VAADEERREEYQMPNSAELTICEPAPFIYFENGQIAVTDGSSVWLVVVTCEAIRATANPPEKSLARLVRYADYYRDLAASAISRGEDVDGKVWVTESAVLSAKAVRFGDVGREVVSVRG
jgi:hypothetical protein